MPQSPYLQPFDGLAMQSPFGGFNFDQSLQSDDSGPWPEAWSSTKPHSCLLVGTSHLPVLDQSIYSSEHQQFRADDTYHNAVLSGLQMPEFPNFCPDSIASEGQFNFHNENFGFFPLDQNIASTNDLLHVSAEVPNAQVLNYGVPLPQVAYSNATPTMNNNGEGASTVYNISDIVAASNPNRLAPDANNHEQKSEYMCSVCQLEHYSERDLESHARFAGHLAFQCKYKDCGEAFSKGFERRRHELETHVEDHGLILSTSGIVCDDCKATFNSTAELDRHARWEQHTPHVCECSERFSRFDVLMRHVKQHESIKPRYPCPHCRRHRGDQAFRRKDHLTQHTRNYHHIAVDDRWFNNVSICPHSDCPQHRGRHWQEKRFVTRDADPRPFANQTAYTKHMREVHNESPYPCEVLHCPRIGGKGYFRKRDMLKHRKNVHPDAPSSVDKDVDTAPSDI